MLVIPSIGNRNQSFVRPSLVSGAFVATHQQDGLPLGVKGKSQAPDFAAQVKLQFFHIGVSRSLQGVDRWSAQIGPKLRKQFGVRQNFILQALRQRGQLVVEIRVKYDIPVSG